jgi:hypothetical protein
MKYTHIVIPKSIKKIDSATKYAFIEEAQESKASDKENERVIGFARSYNEEIGSGTNSVESQLYGYGIYEDKEKDRLRSREKTNFIKSIIDIKLEKLKSEKIKKSKLKNNTILPKRLKQTLKLKRRKAELDDISPLV